MRVLSGDHWMSDDAALEVADPLRFAAGAIEQPDLPALFLFLVGAARGDEREVLVVGAPARRRLAVGRRGELQLFAAVPLHHPDVGVALVLLGIDGRHRVGDPHAVGRSLRIADADDPRVIVKGDGALGRLAAKWPTEAQQCDNDSERSRRVMRDGCLS